MWNLIISMNLSQFTESLSSRSSSRSSRKQDALRFALTKWGMANVKGWIAPEGVWISGIIFQSVGDISNKSSLSIISFSLVNKFHAESRVSPTEKIKIEFYNSQVFVLGYQFLEEIEHSVDRIKKFPKSGKIIKNRVHQYILLSFPYMIFYIVNINYIYLVAIAHQRRKPNYWKERL